MKSFAVTVTFSGTELSNLADIAESHGQRISDFIHDFTLAAATPARARRAERSEQDRQILELTDLGWSKSEIARRLNMNRETVSNRLNRLHQQSRKATN